MVEFKEIPPENLSAADFSKGFVYVDVALTPGLQAEGYAREIIRRIQDMRKEMDLRVEDQIRAVVNVDSSKILDLVIGQKGYIANEVRASELEMGQNLDMLGELVKDWEVEELKLRVGSAESRSRSFYKMSEQPEAMEATVPVKVKVKGVYVADSKGPRRHRWCSLRMRSRGLFPSSWGCLRLYPSTTPCLESFRLGP